MNCKVWFRRILSTCLMVAVFATYSMLALASTGPLAGELTVTGNAGDGQSVTVNGEAAKSGRSVFSSSIISTPASSGALLNLGRSGIIELAPNTTFAVSFDDSSVSGDLTTGKITVVGSPAGVSVKTTSGDVVKLNAGESVTAAGKKDDDDDDHVGGTAWWVWAVVFGGAAAGILIAAVNADNRVAIGGTATTVSPVR
jgi:hypothetical protein